MRLERPSGRMGFALIGVLAFTACSTSPERVRVVRRDSAGIAIVETRAARWGDRAP